MIIRLTTSDIVYLNVLLGQEIRKYLEHLPDPIALNRLKMLNQIFEAINAAEEEWPKKKV